MKGRQQAVCIDRDGVERWRGPVPEGLHFVVPCKEADATITYTGDADMTADPWVWRETSRKGGLYQSLLEAADANRRRTMAVFRRGLDLYACPHCGKGLP